MLPLVAEPLNALVAIVRFGPLRLARQARTELSDRAACEDKVAPVVERRQHGEDALAGGVDVPVQVHRDFVRVVDPVAVPVHRGVHGRRLDAPVSAVPRRRVVAEDRTGSAEPEGLVQLPLVDLSDLVGPEARVVVEPRAAADLEPAELEPVVHDREVVRLVVQMVAPAVAKPEVVAELVHERARLHADFRRARVGRAGTSERDQELARSARIPAGRDAAGVTRDEVVRRDRVMEDGPP